MLTPSNNLLSILYDLYDQYQTIPHDQLMQITVTDKCYIELFKNTQNNMIDIEIHVTGKSILYLYRPITDETFEDLLMYIIDESTDLNLPINHHVYYKQSGSFDSNISNQNFMKLSLDQIPISSGDLLYKKNHSCNLCLYSSKDIIHKCSSCKKVYYCDIYCQKQDWKEHKHNCFESSISENIEDVD
jgi:hypothetical protein